MNKIQKLETDWSKVKLIPAREYRYESLNYPWWVIRNMYTSWRLHIPSYQRWFVRTEEQQIAFLESVAANIPIPPIIIVDLDNANGIDQVRIVDGQQRVTTMMNYLDYLEEVWCDETKIRIYLLNRTIPCTRISKNSSSMEDFDETFYYNLFNYSWTNHI